MGYQSGADDGWRVELSGLVVKSGFQGVELGLVQRMGRLNTDFHGSHESKAD